MNVSKEHHLELAGFGLFIDVCVEQYDGEINTIFFVELSALANTHELWKTKTLIFWY